MSTPRKFFIIAGELSGDIHGARLMKAMQMEDPACAFIGIGGKKMTHAGLRSLFPLEKMAVMGFIEVIKHLWFFRQVERTVIKTIMVEKPERLILIDYPGFNLRIAEKVKKKFNIPTTYYISPQVWAWKESRIKHIKKFVDQMLVIFPFEKGWYAQRNMPVEWVGHPYLEEWQPQRKNDLKKKLGFDPEKPLLVLFPGSRQQELDQHLDICLTVAERLRMEIPQLQISIGLSSTLAQKDIEVNENIHIEKDHPKQLLEAADAAIIASGTATLEATIYGIPHVIIYKMNVFSWLISKIFVKTEFAGMPNLIAGKELVPELLQSQATAHNLTKNIVPMLIDEKKQEKIKQELIKVRDSLGDGHASHKAAWQILHQKL